ncbi:MAG: hypothetical protein HC813_00265 [Planctomycetes bacterium]|nr:hypothetical protein [Planctomycetota bacterium]
MGAHESSQFVGQRGIDEWVQTYSKGSAAYNFIQRNDVDLKYRMATWAGEEMTENLVENVERRAGEAVVDDAEREYRRERAGLLEERTEQVVCAADKESKRPCVPERLTGKYLNPTQPNDPEERTETDGWLVEASAEFSKAGSFRRKYAARVCIRAYVKCTPVAEDHTIAPARANLRVWYWRPPGEPAPIPWRSKGPHWAVLNFNARPDPGGRGLISGTEELPAWIRTPSPVQRGDRSTAGGCGCDRPSAEATPLGESCSCGQAPAAQGAHHWGREDATKERRWPTLHTEHRSDPWA